MESKRTQIRTQNAHKKFQKHTKNGGDPKETQSRPKMKQKSLKKGPKWNKNCQKWT